MYDFSDDLDIVFHLILKNAITSLPPYYKCHDKHDFPPFHIIYDITHMNAKASAERKIGDSGK
jgi:hypothetical protein